ncbi:ATP synthase F1 subunit delta [Acetobacter thailandicus]|uniref:ATP synthase F1 subunit delta n=1 Tax=Acetobacter thailandicus TaxID=1502842 RepID=UPI001BA73C3B|nr:ATP synthase F1 subunit delta [Acetobacter thailandicus]MBS0979781.1 ATP synthase F1 subunit delta [Acetobacter thailandicus]
MPARRDGKNPQDVVTSGVTTEHSPAYVATGPEGRYATALYKLAEEQKQLDTVLDEADALARLIDESAPLRTVLSDTRLDTAVQKKAIFSVLASQGFGETIRNFAGVVTTNRRLPILRRILEVFSELAAARRGESVAEVVSAQALTDAQRDQLKLSLAQAGYAQVVVRESVDPSLLGGLVVRVGARLYDASIQTRLFHLHYAMKGAA